MFMFPDKLILILVLIALLCVLPGCAAFWGAVTGIKENPEEFKEEVDQTAATLRLIYPAAGGAATGAAVVWIFLKRVWANRKKEEEEAEVIVKLKNQ